MRHILFSGLLGLFAVAGGGCHGCVNPDDVLPPLHYEPNPATYVVGEAIADNRPYEDGRTAAFQVVPPLPPGLSMDGSSGVISGTPLEVSPATAYTVSATKGDVTTTAALTITVIDVAPHGLSYSKNPAVYALGRQIQPNAPSSDGGRIATYAINPPSLPAGLGFDDATGVISGTPLQLSATTWYTVTGLNTRGSVDVPVAIAVTAEDTVGQRGVVVTGGDFTCALVNGTVLCWGKNDQGQLGNGSDAGSSVPLPVAGLTTGVQSIAAGGAHACAVVNGAAWCWGKNDEGQLGNNSQGNSYVPVPATTLDAGVQAVTAGNKHACAIVNGGAWCWGMNDRGQLGIGSAAARSLVPRQLPALTTGVQVLTAGGGHTCAVANGAAYCWGAGGQGQLGIGGSPPPDATSPVGVSGLSAGVQAITAGSTHTCAVVNGKAWCWGNNSNLQLGIGGVGDQYVPIQLGRWTSGGVQDITAGLAHTCAVSNGGAWCWGNNNAGRLGDGTVTNAASPVPVSSLDAGVQGLVAGDTHTCALVNGGVQCWGSGASGQLGNSSPLQRLVPDQVSGLTAGLQEIAAGARHACALVNGGVQCWGDNSSGQLGVDSPAYSARPVRVTGLLGGVQEIAAGARHTCALISGGARCWGGNARGQLGDGTTTERRSPVPVAGLPAGARAIAAGDLHSCAVVNGGAFCWGDNSSGQLGNNGADAGLSVAAVTGLATGVRDITAGARHTCALAGGGVKCWGANDQGQLGNNTTTPFPAPVDALPSGAQAVSARGDNSCALVGGSVRCWGNNAYGQLGDGTTQNSDVPIPANGLDAGAQAIASGGRYACALVNGGVRCWGTAPGNPLGLTSVQGISAGDDFSCALVNGGVQCWGANATGQLGDDSTADSPVPVPVAPWVP